MAGGRPTEYNDALLAKAREYVANLPDDEKVHSIEGLALYVGISRETVYAWEKARIEGTDMLKYEDFSDIVEQVRAKQAKTLVNKGLTSEFNSSIAKVMLSKHGYREGFDTTTNDKDLPTPILGGLSLNENKGTDTKI